MKFKNQRLKDYIFGNTTAGVRGRAKSVAVKNLQFATDHSSASAKVRGSTGTSYTVTFYGLQYGLLSSSCTCPFDYGNVCKHEVAVAQMVDDHMDLPARGLSAIVQKKKSTKKKQEAPSSLDLPFTSTKDITNSYLIEHCSPTVYRELTYYSADVEVRETNDNSALFIVLPYYGRIDYAAVQLKKKDGDTLNVRCSCKKSFSKLCIHQAVILDYISENLPHLFMDKRELDRQKDELLAAYGFSIKDSAHKTYFDFDHVHGKLVAIPKKGVVRLSKYKDYEPLCQALFTEESSIVNTLPFIKKKTKDKKRTLAVGLALMDGFREDAPSVISVPLKGNLKRDGSTLVSKIAELDAGELLNNEEGFTDNEMTILKKALAFSSNTLYDLGWHSNDLANVNHYILTQLQQLLPHLGDTLVLGVELYDQVQKKDLYPIAVSPKSAELSFAVEEEKDFYVLRTYISFGGKKRSQLSADIGQNFLFSRNAGVWHLNKSMHFCKTLAAFRNNPEIRIKKDDFEGYYQNFIVPLSKKYQVEVAHRKNEKLQQINVALVKKQIYLSVVEDHVVFRPMIDHSGTTFAPGRPQEILTVNGDETFTLSRNGDFETTFLNEIQNLHPSFEYQQENIFYLNTQDFVKDTWFLSAFENLREKDIEVFGHNNLKHLKYNLHPPSIQMSVNSGMDWFDVSLSVAFGDQNVSLANLKKAVVAKNRYVPLDDGTLGILPEDWVQKYAHLFRSGSIKKDRITVSKYQLSVIDSLYDDLDLESEMVQEHLVLKEKLRSFSSIEKVKTPKGIKAVLRDYQKEGLNWLNFLDEYGFGGCLADDMGLGKTLQVITFLEYLKTTRKPDKPHLIVVPTSLIFNWSEEVKKFCPGLKLLNLTGAERSQHKENLGDHDGILTTYGTLLRDIDGLKDTLFEYVILDESQAIKNPNSKRYKAVRMLQAKNRLVLTGTPIENNTFDLYAQMTFINPGLLGTLANFKKEYATPIDKDKDADIANELRRLIAPFLLRRTKEQVAKELPDKTEQVLYCTMGKAQQKVYDAYRNKYRDYLMGKIEKDGLGKSKLYVLEGLTKLRQICDAPILLGDEEGYSEESIKIDTLMEQVMEKTGEHKILVFSQFVSMLQLIKARLKKEGVVFEYLDGRTKNRQQRVDNFQNNTDVRVFLISLKAGGTGLNLTAADYVFLVDPWWNPAVEAQAIDRCYRIGQEKKVMAYKMICKNTIEEKIVSLQMAKKQLSADIVQTDESFVKSLSKERIAQLFGE
ncbi:SNF2-related protein [Maribacter sp. 2307ULW6-5]|uniref:SNF2-related protein n=1 Tax=Maribacter sp. 2307ULW6-5 TaxID=3386275 RepID=UPI0039BC2D3E